MEFKIGVAYSVFGDPDPDITTAKIIKRFVNGRFATSDRGDLLKLREDGRVEVLPEDEPLFLIRARDWLAIKTLSVYKVLAEEDRCTSYLIDGVTSAIMLFKKFRHDNPSRMKQPGVTRGL